MVCMLRLSVVLFLFQSGYHAYLATIPIAMEQMGFGYAAIGLATSSAATAQVFGALLSGAVIDRFGPFTVLILVGLGYAAASLLLAMGGGVALGLPVIITARILQGVSFGSLLPAAVTLLSRIIPRDRLGGAIGLVTVAPNVAYAVIVPLSIAILAASSLQALGLLTGCVVLLGVAILVTSKSLQIPSLDSPIRRRLLPTFSRSWLGPIVITFLTSLPLGVILTLLAIQEPGNGTDSGLFFAAAGVTTLTLRVLGGRLADRGRTRMVLTTGVLASVLCSLLLIGGAHLAAAGVAEGLSGAFILPAVALMLLDRAAPNSRGSALGVNSASGSAALAISSLASGVLASKFSFDAILMLATAGCLPALALAWLMTRPDSMPETRVVGGH
jgi:MFS family permease